MKAHDNPLNMAPRISNHAGKRLRQRSLRESDLVYIQQCGEVFSDGYFMSGRAISKRLLVLKAEIQRLERLKGTVLIEENNTVVTVYRADRRGQRRILRHRSRSGIHYNGGIR